MAIRDVTPLVHEIHGLVRAGDLAAARSLLPAERPYPAGAELIGHLTPPRAEGSAAASSSGPAT